MFVRYGLRLAAIGIACGLVAAIALDAADGVAAVRNEPARSADLRRRVLGLVVAAVLASYVPAARATAVNPVDGPEGGVAIGFGRALTTPRARR